jgi:hypothetical protein
VFVEAVADPSQIQDRSGDRKAAVEMAFGASRGNRAQVKELFRQLQRVRAVKAEPAEPERVVNLCRQAAADLQQHAIRNVQEATRRAETHQQLSFALIRLGNANRAEAWGTASDFKRRDIARSVSKPH